MISIENTNVNRFELNGFLKYFSFTIQTIKLLKIIQPDIIIAGDLFSLPAACNYLQSKIIYDSREIYSHLAALKKNPVKQFFWKKVEAKYIHRAYSTIVTADSDLNFLEKEYSLHNITVIKNYPSKTLEV